MAPVLYIGRYMKGWLDLAIADELHQLAGDTTQGNALGVLARAGRRLVALTGTLMGGYADDLFNVFYRMEPAAIVCDGFVYGGEGRRDFQQQYGVLETIEKVRDEDNACSRASKKTVQVIKKPGASPVMFDKFLMPTLSFSDSAILLRTCLRTPRASFPATWRKRLRVPTTNSRRP